MKWICFIVLISLTLFAQEDSSNSSKSSTSGVGKTQNKRSLERFNILDWISANKKKMAEQDSKYGSSGGIGRGPTPDFVLDYRVENSDITRDGVKVGKEQVGIGRLQFLLDDLFSGGNKRRSFNMDLGVEGYYASTREFKVDTTSTQQDFSYTEIGGALLLRPIGKSSQDTSLMLKVGYSDIKETGFWSNTNVPKSIYGTYLGAEAKLYLLPFLGARGEYQTFLENDNPGLNGKWKSYRFLYGAFLEIYLLKVEGFVINTERILTNTSGVSVKDYSTGAGFSGTLYF
jgi:hypothetical protein